MSSSFEELFGRLDGSPPPIPSIEPPPARAISTAELDALHIDSVVATAEPDAASPDPSEPVTVDGGAESEQIEPPAVEHTSPSPAATAQVEAPAVEPVRQEPTTAEARPRVGFDLPELDPVGAVRPMVDPADADRALSEAVELAREEAFLAGVDEGMKREQSRLDAARGALTSAVSDLVASDERRSTEAEERIRVLAAGVAAHIVEREVRASPELVSDLVRRAIAEFPVNDPLRVHLNPADIALLTGDAGGDLGGGRSIRWMPDPNILSGGCLIEGSEQVVDARLLKTLDRIVRAMTDE